MASTVAKQGEWSLVWRWILGRLGKKCQSYIDTTPKLECELRHGHLVKHRQGGITWEIGTLGD